MTAESEYKRFQCTHCTLEFEAPKAKRYCTRKCNQAAIKKNKSGVSRAEYVAKSRENSGSTFTCECCQKVTHRKLSSTNRAKGFVNRWCSHACRSKQAADVRKMSAGRRAKVATEIAALKRIARHIEKPSVFRLTCIHCAAPMIVKRNGGLHQTVCGDCTKESRSMAKKAARKKQRAVGLGCDSHRKKARKYGGRYDPSVSWLRVFERDKWKCHLCGIKTPKVKRGTYDDDAPELDHVVPLSLGGAHTWENVKCSCRKCNGIKGATVVGQLGLDLF